ncbi:MAG TPA: tail fiber protein [Polyangia bacterium]|jgi:microcystin-dependent protein
MADPYVGEIRIFPYTYAPAGWLLCNGQQVSVQQNSALFSIIGTTYGGDGQTTFNLPNLQASGPLGFGSAPGRTPRGLGAAGGAATVALTLAQTPSHNHNVAVASADAGTTAVTTPTNATLFGGTQAKAKTTGYVTVAGQALDVLDAAAVLPMGDSTPHNNLPPFLTFNFCIATTGVYPMRP